MNQLKFVLIIIGLLIWTELSGQSKMSNTKISDLEWTDVKDKIYPMLKQTLPETDTLPLIEVRENEKPIIDYYIADIHIVYLIEFDNYFTYVNKGQVAKWKIDQDSLKKTALLNLDNLANGKAEFHGDSTFAMIILNGNVEASLMLSDNFWPYISDIIKNKDLVIGVPTRDVLLVTHVGCEKGLEKLRKGVKQTFELGDHEITKWTFKRENNKWIKFENIE